MTFLLPTTPAFLRFQAQRRGAHPSLIFRARPIPCGELAAAVEDLTRWLARRGIGHGHHVALVAGNTPAIVAMTYAVWGVGAVAVLISARATAPEIAHLLGHARAAALLCDAARVEVGRAGAAAAGVPLWACEADLPLRPRVVRRGAIAARAPAAARPDALAAIAYTSGTTGTPRGVMITHGNLFWSALACGQARGDRPATVGASISPLTHVPVFVSHMLCRLLLGSTVVLFEKFDTATLLDAVPRFGITDVSVIAGMVFDLVQLGSVPAPVRDTLEKVTVGGAPIPMETKRALRALFTRSEITEAYGQSEATDGVTLARGTSVFDRPGTVGTANPHVRLAVRRPDGTLAEPEEDGEIVIAGPTVMRGYYRDRATTAAALRDGWLHSGDRGRCDTDGYFYITGRVKDLIITGGENVSPAEVEAVLRTHPAVADVAVLGTPHPKWGEQVTAVVVRRDGAALAAAELIDFARRRLAGFKLPRRVEFVAALPRNAANKVQVERLRAALGANAE
jgi:acyl-CoA synthetase (AMP-forming)/AMP-acid ligase II